MCVCVYIYRERERNVDLFNICSLYSSIHLLILACALTGYQTQNLGILRQHSNQLSYLVKVQLILNSYYMLTRTCLGGSQNHSQVWWFTGRNHRTQHVIVVMTKTHYSKRVLSNVSKGKAPRAKSGEHQEGAFNGVLQDWFDSYSCECWQYMQRVVH